MEKVKSSVEWRRQTLQEQNSRSVITDRLYIDVKQDVKKKKKSKTGDSKVVAMATRV